MLKRCYNTNHKSYADYGGRGITVCPRWRASFKNFLADMGEMPVGKTIDRYPDNDGNYEPGNCRWATPKEQANNRRGNRRLACGERDMTLAQWADECGITTQAMFRRIKNGWPLERALLSGKTPNH